MESGQYTRSAVKGTYISIIAYLFLAIIKLTAGYFGQSQALWADGLNNTTDIVASLAVLIGLYISRRPPDSDHLYGHRRAETIASMVVAFIMATIGLQVILGAGTSFTNASIVTPNRFTAFIAFFSAILMLGIYQYNLRLSKRINSASIFAVAQDNKSDALVSLGAGIGIMGATIGVVWLDSLTALIVGIIICKTAWDIFRSASHSLSDGFDEGVLNEMKKTIKETDGVLRVGEIKARTHGNAILLEATIYVAPHLSVVEGHEITEHIEENLKKGHPIIHTIIHIEPDLKEA